MGHVLEMEPFRQKRTAGNRTPIHEICLLKHVPGKGLLIFQDEAESAISDPEVRLLFGQAAIDLAASEPDEWCAIVTDDEEWTRRAAAGQKPSLARQLAIQDRFERCGSVGPGRAWS